MTNKPSTSRSNNRHVDHRAFASSKARLALLTVVGVGAFAWTSPTAAQAGGFDIGPCRPPRSRSSFRLLSRIRSRSRDCRWPSRRCSPIRPRTSRSPSRRRPRPPDRGRQGSSAEQRRSHGYGPAQHRRCDRDARFARCCTDRPRCRCHVHHPSSVGLIDDHGWCDVTASTRPGWSTSRDALHRHVGSVRRPRVHGPECVRIASRSAHLVVGSARTGATKDHAR